MERDDGLPKDPYRSPGFHTAEDVPPAAPPREAPSTGKVVVVTLLLMIGVPIAAIVLLFAVCTAFVAFA